MVIADANLLIYAHNPGAVQHRKAADWLENQLQARDGLGLTWSTIWAFIRILSNPRLWARPVAVDALFDRIDEWLLRPNVILVQPGSRHRAILQSLMNESGSGGTVATNAALAAIAIEHAATLASTDRDFKRFSGLRLIDPLD